MYVVKSKIGPNEVCDTSHPDQRKMGLFCGWIWSMDEELLNDVSPLETLKHLSTWSYHFFFFIHFFLFFSFFSLFLFNSSMSPLLRELWGYF